MLFFAGHLPWYCRKTRTKDPNSSIPSMYAARYHDRLNLKEYRAQAWFQSGLLCIELETEVGPQTLEWSANQIHSIVAHADGQVIVQNGRQYIEVQDLYFKTDFDRVMGPKAGRQKGFFDKIGIKGCFVGLALLIVPLILAYFYLAPWLANRAAEQISPQTEAQIGNTWAQAILATSTVDSFRTAQLQAFYDSLHYGGPYSMHLTVVKAPIENAFALPGGQIVVYDHMLDLVKTPEQLAALLAHETSHILLKHSTKSIFRAMAGRIALLSILGDFGSIAGMVAQQGDALASLSYSRALEREADQNGLKLMEKSQIPLRGMPDLFRNMLKSSPEGNSGGMSAFLSTHPALEERIQETELVATEKTNQPDTLRSGLVRIWQKLK